MSNQAKVEQILDLLERNDRSMSWLAKEVGASRQSVQQWLSEGIVPRDPQVFDRMLRALRGSVVSHEPLIVREHRLDGSLPFAGVVPCGPEWGDPLSATGSVAIESSYVHSDRFAARVVGHSCYPALLPGDLTVWHVDSSPPYGLIVLAERDGDHGCTVKVLEYDSGVGRSVLKPVNTDQASPPDGEGWSVIARLVAVVRIIDGLRRTWYLEHGIRPRHLA
ncbi:MAG TPA: S24 family peptidase [Fimbriimonadaceae bacterium]|nr:S24 family peptidase [Fimbriimonadaceae bacterium]